MIAEHRIDHASARNHTLHAQQRARIGWRKMLAAPGGLGDAHIIDEPIEEWTPGKILRQDAMIENFYWTTYY